MNARQIAKLVESEIGHPIQMITVSQDDRDGVTVIGVDWPDFCNGAGVVRGDVLVWSASRGTEPVTADDVDDIPSAFVWFSIPEHRIDAAWCIAQIKCRFVSSQIAWSVTGDSGVEPRHNLSLTDARAYLSHIRETHAEVDRVAMDTGDINA